jgi:hypothetical protein
MPSKMAQTTTSDSFWGSSMAWYGLVNPFGQIALVIWRTLVASRKRVTRCYLVPRTPVCSSVQVQAPPVIWPLPLSPRRIGFARSRRPFPRARRRDDGVLDAMNMRLLRKLKANQKAAFSQYSHLTHIRFLVLFTIFEQLKFPNCHIPDFQKPVENTRAIQVFLGRGDPERAINY